MAIMQIAEPGQSLQSPQQKKIGIGIDLGTTNSLVATVKEGNPETLTVGVGDSMPSAVHVSATDGVLLGQDAVRLAESDADNTLRSFKRHMGVPYEVALERLGESSEQHAENRIHASDMGGVAYQTDAGLVSPIQASSYVLSALGEKAIENLGHIDGAVITVPAYFDDRQRAETKEAAKLAGIEVLRLLNEPTAAAVAYGLDTNTPDGDRTVAVYDLGGGTFDISVLSFSQGVFQVQSTGGDTSLGGDDFDQVIATWILEQADIASNAGSLNRNEEQQLLNLARAVKEKLSNQDIVELSWRDWNGSLDRQTHDALLHPLIKKTIQACRRALRDASLQKADIDDVVLVGGSTRVAAVRQQVADFFDKQPLTNIDPDRVVALGAAIQADILVGNRKADEALLLDVIPLSLGIETMGGLVEKVIHRNTPIPAARAQEFTTYRDGQTAMKIHVVQGERELVKDNRSLASFELRDIPPMVAGAAKIRVTFQVDADGLLSISAQETTQKVATSVQVLPSFGLSEREMTAMLQSSYQNARSDMEMRSLVEKQVEADRLLESLQAALDENGHELLNQAQREELHEAMKALQSARYSGTPSQIGQHIDQLNQMSTAFAALRMDASIKQALTGKTVAELES